jgi:hypothetical protein
MKMVRKTLRRVENAAAHLDAELREPPFEYDRAMIMKYLDDLRASVLDLGVAIRGRPSVRRIDDE